MREQSLTGLLELHREHENKYIESALEIDLYLDYDFLYNGIECHVFNYDIDLNYVEICPSDGETWINDKGKYLRMKFEEFDSRCIKLY